MRTSIILILPFAAVTLAQTTSTTVAISQVSDGQPQASASSYSNGFTSYLTETNSLGVVTGQPSVVTSQPVAVTSQASVITSQTAAASFVSGSVGIPAVSSSAIPIVSPPVVTSVVQGSASGFSTVAGSNTTVAGATLSGTSSAAGSGTAAGSSTATGTSGSTATSAGASSSTTSESAADAAHPALGLGFAAALFAAFL